MPGKKQELDPEAYERWYARHRVVETERRRRIRDEQNPIKALPVEERGVLRETYSLEEAFWHPLHCECGSCDGRYHIKQVRLMMRPIPPAVKSVTAHLPELPNPVQRLLQDVEERFLSTEG
jgi:hypothetical protein